MESAYPVNLGMHWFIQEELWGFSNHKNMILSPHLSSEWKSIFYFFAKIVTKLRNQ